MLFEANKRELTARAWRSFRRSLRVEAIVAVALLNHSTSHPGVSLRGRRMRSSRRGSRNRARRRTGRSSAPLRKKSTGQPRESTA